MKLAKQIVRTFNKKKTQKQIRAFLHGPRKMGNLRKSDIVIIDLIYGNKYEYRN